MPMHDWTRVDPNDYHDFHGAWIFAIRTALNNGLLPKGYFALGEHSTPPFVPDVVTLSIPDDPPLPLPRDWVERVNRAETEAELEQLLADLG